MAVGAEERGARLAEALQVDLVANAVAGAREADAVAARDRQEVAVVVGVLEAGLEGVVVDIADRELGGEAFDAHGLELEIGHRPRRVLRQGLVDADADFAAALPLAFDEVRLEDLPRQALAHAASDLLAIYTNEMNKNAIPSAYR